MIVASVIIILLLMLPLFFGELRQNRLTLLAYLFVIGIHQLVAVINVSGITVVGANADAATFNRIGFELAQSDTFSFAIGSKLYENMLGIVYWLFGSSHFLGEQLSIMAFTLSCIVLIKILKQLHLSRYQVPILIAFGALPTMVILGSITMRESYQVLFFMLAVYFGIRMHLEGGLNRNLLFLIISALLMGLFHNGLIVYAFFLVFSFMVFSLRPGSGWLRMKKLHVLLYMMAPVMAATILIIAKTQVAGVAALSALANMDLIEYASNYREHSVTARATYGILLDTSSLYTFIYSVILAYVYYLFSPFPWQLSNALDVYAAVESFLRMMLLYYSIKQWRISGGVQRRLLGLMLVLFFSMTFLWSMGTTNYGTAMRHHVLTLWILLVTGMPALIDKFCYAFNQKTRSQLSVISGKK